jgi:hypothetical protein
MTKPTNIRRSIAVGAALIGLGLAACGGATKTVTVTAPTTTPTTTPTVAHKSMPVRFVSPVDQTVVHQDHVKVTATVPLAQDYWIEVNNHKVGTERDGNTVTTEASLKRGTNFVELFLANAGVSGPTKGLRIIYRVSAAQLAAQRAKAKREEAAARAERIAERQRKAAERQRKLAAETLSFSGNGSKNLGTIHVPTDSTLSWTCDGDLFILQDENYDIFVNSQGHSGTTVADAGTYKKVDINAIGNWTVKISPR